MVLNMNTKIVGRESEKKMMEKVNSWLFMTFSTTLTQIFPEKFIKIYQVVQKI